MLNKTLNTYNKSSKFYEENQVGEFPVVAQQVKNPTSIQEDAVRSLVSLSGLRSRRCRELWCRSHPRLGCHPIAIAMAKAGSCGSNSTPRLGTSIRCKCGPKKKKKESG